MNILAINGSPHGEKGTTGMLLAEVVRQAQAAGASVTTLSVADHKVSPCLACDSCHKTGLCPIKDDFPCFRDALVSADGVILASPNYLVSVTAQIKAVMDRCCGLLHCLALKNKYAVAVVTSGGGGCQEVEAYMLAFLRHMGSWTVGSTGATAAMLQSPPDRVRALESAAGLGKTLVQAIRQRRTYPDQLADQNTFAQRMKQLVEFRKDLWAYEYEYWKSRGWL
jgi:multimeric flavodoxin WrbA